MVFFPDRHPAAGHHHVGRPGSICQRQTGGGEAVGDGGQIADFAAHLRQDAAQPVSVGIVDTAGEQGFARFGQLVAGKEHRHAQRAQHFDFRLADRSDQPDVGRLEPAAGGHHHRAGGNVLAGAADVLSGPGGAGHQHAIALLPALLLHHHAVGTGGNRGPGENAGGGTRLQRLRLGAGRYALADGQRLALGPVGDPQGKAVHGAVVLRRHGQTRHHVTRQYPPAGTHQRQHLGFGQPAGPVKQPGAGIVERKQGRSSQERYLSQRKATTLSTSSR